MQMNSFMRRTLPVAACAIAAGLFSINALTANATEAAPVRLAQAPAIATGEPNPAADIALQPIFNSGMVLQRDLPIPFWGTAAPGQKVTVTLGKQSVSTIADAAGKWLLRLKPVKAGGPYEVTVTGRNTITYKDVLIGDVWLASGQSNMSFGVGGAINGAEEIKNSTDPQLRMFTIAGTSKFDEPQSSVGGNWATASPTTTQAFTAVGYFFARELRKEIKVPIAVIHSSWSGTVAQAWTRREVLLSDPATKPSVDNWATYVTNYPATQAKYTADLKAWQDTADAAKAAGQPVPANKPQPPESLTSPNRPSTLYNGMIAPLIPYGIKGVIWYQGESNGMGAEQYKKLFPALITGWRKDWGEGDFPFLYVQLANWLKVQEVPAEGGWAPIREAQSQTLSLPNTGMAVTLDVGDAVDIHPKNKQEVGRRLALIAEAQVYGRKIPYSGPRYDSMKVQGNAIILRFTHIDGGLKPRDGEELKGFAIAGADKKFVWGTAKIAGKTIVVSSPDVAAPAAVRYSWAFNPIGNLYNGAGLPASSFRTDVW